MGKQRVTYICFLVFVQYKAHESIKVDGNQMQLILANQSSLLQTSCPDTEIEKTTGRKASPIIHSDEQTLPISMKRI